MRISDWSSDVCSSDLGQRHGVVPRRIVEGDDADAVPALDDDRLLGGRGGGRGGGGGLLRGHALSVYSGAGVDRSVGGGCGSAAKGGNSSPADVERQSCGDPVPSRRLLRSEEHTSELQSLMRISYAVFCLKKKKNRE